jgi:hypothetical protein
MAGFRQCSGSNDRLDSAENATKMLLGGPMPLAPYLSEGSFDPPAIDAMSAAYRAACASLGLVDRTDPLNEIVARKVIEIAGTGELDPQRLTELVLLAFSEDKRIA